MEHNREALRYAIFPIFLSYRSKCLPPRQSESVYTYSSYDDIRNSTHTKQEVDSKLQRVNLA